MVKNFDRLSLLPDSLLLIIISLLPFKEAARTCILGKRWVHMWAKVPTIEFNESFFVKANDTFYRRVAQKNAFLRFMKLWLENRDDEGVMEKFSLKLLKPDEEFHEIIERCLAFVTKHGVKELVLDFSNPIWENGEIFPTKRKALFDLPTHVYENKTIESLSLYSCSFLENGFINLHALKEVSFSWIEVTLEAITTLVSNCKMMESLTLIHCWNSTHFEIGHDGLRLKRLIVESCIFDSPLFIVNAPNLCFFKYRGTMKIFEINPPLALEEAHLDFSPEFENAGLGDYLHNLIRELYAARVVTICSYVLQVLPDGHMLHMEHDMNARHLTMKMNMLDGELRGVSFWLRSCPMLESLTIDLGFGRTLNVDVDMHMEMAVGEDENAGEEDYFIEEIDEAIWIHNGDGGFVQTSSDYQSMWLSSLSVYECLNSTLKLVEVNNFVGSMNGLLFLYFIIRCGKVLERLNVNVHQGGNGGAKVAFYRQVEEFMMTTPRASSDLQISFRY